MAKPRQIEKGSYNHIYSRGVNKCDIFKDDSDYLFFQSLIERFNTTKINRRNKKLKKDKNSGTKLVEVFCYTLMPNHFHFILKGVANSGISKFLHKVLGRYARYFNDKYGRVGSLFGSRFKNKLVSTDHYFEHLVAYIWNNPIKLINPKYKSKDLLNGKIELSKKEKKFALNYSYKKFPKNYFGPEHKKLTKTNFEMFDF